MDMKLRLPNWLITLTKPIFRKPWKDVEQRHAVTGKASTSRSIELFGYTFELRFTSIKGQE